jgi:hypothetical protein
MNKVYLLFVTCGFLLFTSCKKTAVDNETTSSTDYAMLSQEFMQILPAVNERAVAEKGLGSTVTSTFSVCPIDSLSGDTTHNSTGVFTDTTNLPVMWLKYNNCVGSDGKTRNGTIKISFTKKYNVIGCVATATLSNYSVNGVSYTGVLSITRNSANEFTYNITDGTFKSNTFTTKFSCNAIATLSDNGTPTVNDDFLMILGNANGTNRDNHKYDVTISESLKKRADCPWISQGKASLTPEGLHTRAIDFGNGNCDDIASFVLDSQTFTIHLSK